MHKMTLFEFFMITSNYIDEIENRKEKRVI